MSSLKAIKAHAVAVGNIQKITNSIKMIATSKFLTAEKKLRKARVLGQGSRRFYVVTKISYDEKNGRSTVVTSDRGLCGGLHTRVCRKVKTDQAANPSEGGIICLGEKAKSLLALTLKKRFKLVVNGIGHRGPSFKQASSISQEIFGEWHLSMLTFPYFINILSFDVVTFPLMTSELVANSTVPYKYEIEQDDLDFYCQFSTASLIYYSMNEAFVSELASRVTAMTVASKNAGKLKKHLMLQYNRKRQEKITTEIIDIISGLKATMKKKKKSDRNLKYLMDATEGPQQGVSEELSKYDWSQPMEATTEEVKEAGLQPQQAAQSNETPSSESQQPKKNPVCDGEPEF